MSHCLRWFIDYWDRVVDVWLDKHSIIQSKVVYANRPLELEKEKEDYYKDDHLTVNIEIEQLPWFKDETTAKFLCPIHMPEPYWGNPEKCSIVIINYNPGGGLDMSPHTYKGKGAPYPDNTMIEYVNRKSYSALASDFPLLKTKEELEKDERWWLRSYGGRKWWLRKKEWMLHLVQAWEEEGEKQSNGKEVKWPISIRRPFAIELCGWHSHNWNDCTANIINEFRKENMQKYFIYPLLQSIENSTTQLAICIGKQFKSDNFCFSPKGNITEEIAKMLKANDNNSNTGEDGSTIEKNEEKAISVKCNVGRNDIKYDVFYETKKIRTIEVNVENKKKEKKKTKTGEKGEKRTETTRHYRIYDIKYNNCSHIIINTYVQGSNHHPAQHFWPFENSLIKVIKNYQNQKDIQTINNDYL